MTAMTTFWKGILFQITKRDCIWQITAAITLLQIIRQRRMDTAFIYPSPQAGIWSFGNHLIDNGYNAYDMGQNNRWDNGSVGNYYSDLGRIFYVPGGPSVDRHPMAEGQGA